MAKYIPKLLEKIALYEPSKKVNENVDVAFKLARTLVLASRAIGAARGKFTQIDEPLKKRIKDAVTPFRDTNFPFPEEAKGSSLSRQAAARGILPLAGWDNRPSDNEDSYKGTPIDYRRNITRIENPISILNLDSREEPFTDLSKYEKLELHSVPKELKYDPSSNFVGLASIGRNNPHYNYTGSEDTLEFSIDWYCKGLDRAEVIKNCRWVEALSKGDGYSSKPPRIQLIWGKENVLFNNQTWIVVSAGYTLSNFQDGHNGLGTNDRTMRPFDGRLTSMGNLPQQAYQNVKLKRVTNTNRTHKQIKGGSTPKELESYYKINGQNFFTDNPTNSPNANLF